MDKVEGIVFISIPIVGHLIPMVALARRLAPRFSVTILTMTAPIPSWAMASDAYLRSLRTSTDFRCEDGGGGGGDNRTIRFVELPTVDFAIDDARHAFTTMSLFVDAHKSHVKDAIRGLRDSHVRVVGVVTDFVTSMIDAANELQIPAYVYFPSSAACLSVMVWPPPPSRLRDDMVEVVGISPVPAHALPSLMSDPDGYDKFTYHGRRFNEAKGVIVNTFQELEPAVVQALCSCSVLPPVYAVGPILSPAGSDGQHECIQWLDEQPPASVVFLCFGSMGCFGPDQVREIATGLERSGNRFLWVLRGPSDCGPPVDADLQHVGLPEGFLERTSGQGMVWPSWAPQVDVLLHAAVGGFVTHCGWNSVLEGVWAGVPMLAWPLYAEQKFNACEMVRDMGVAVGLPSGDDGRKTEEEVVMVVVAAEVVEKGVRRLMGEDEEGRRVRARAGEAKAASRKAVGARGSSWVAGERWLDQLRP